MVFCLYLQLLFFENMNSYRVLLPFVFIITLVFSSCKDTDEYRVDSEFSSYLQQFVDSAAVRGRFFDFRRDGLIIEFSKLKKNNSGLTHFENPIRIEIDRSYWEAITSTAGGELMKENLIFHELGHGLLNRDHLNLIFENGDWKSIMCGGEKVNNRNWNINYKGIRRFYYINELFNESTPFPRFSSNLLNIDTTALKPAFYLDFNTEKTAGWAIREDANQKISLESRNGDGKLCFQSKLLDTYLVLLKTSVDVQTDFKFQLELEFNSVDQIGQYGLVFGNHSTNLNGNNETLEYFTINNNKNMYVGNRSWYSYYTELTKAQIKPQTSNVLIVFKKGNMIYYFINNEYCYSTEMETSAAGFYYGFIVPPLGTVLVDNFIVSGKTNACTKDKINKNQVIEFETVRVKSLNQAEIIK